ncbi:MAG: guanylate kinase [Pontimonas sp.]|jgi:guanylate kinase
MADFDAHAASTLGVAARQARATLKATIASGEENILELFDRAQGKDADSILAGLRVEWFLRSIPGMGSLKVQRVLDAAGVLPRATLGGLRIRQRTALRAEVVTLFRRYYDHLRGQLVIIVGPSGVGKGTIVRWILDHRDGFALSVSATTRAPRGGEREGDHYFFVSEAQFDDMVARGELLEWALVHRQHRYGTPQAAVEVQLDQGTDVILEIDIQGAKAVRRAIGSAVTVFVAPPSFEELERRLAGRGTEDAPQRMKRLATARRELRTQESWDAVVINHDVADSGQSIVDLVSASREARASKE